MGTRFKGPLPKDKGGRTVNTPEWWDRKGRNYLHAGDLRHRDDEARILAKLVQAPVLEVGPAFGRFADLLPAGSAYIGIEISRLMVARARADYPGRLILAGDFMKVGRGWHGAVETICAFQVIEHFASEEAFLRQALKVARSRLIFSVPRGKPSASTIVHDGHINWWEDEDDLEASFSKFLPNGLARNFEFVEGRANHICGVLTWQGE